MIALSYRLLLVDKQPENYHFINACIGQLNNTTNCFYKLDWISSTEEKKTALSFGKYDAYLIDSQFLPSLNRQTIEYLIKQVNSAPVIILTNNYELGMIAIEAGAADYLDKTQLTLAALERSLRLTLANSRLQLGGQLNIALSQAELLESEIKQRQELARSNAELEQFAYLASHDLQAPLQTISNYAQLLERRYCGQLDEKANKFIKYIVDAAQRMRTQINDLLEYSRFDRQRSTFRHTDCNLVVEQAIANLRSEIEKNEAVITCQDNLPTLIGDSSQLVVLFQNLIGNSIKYRSRSQPVIKITAIARENCWQFSVTDNGIGIEPKYRQRIFQIFQRLHTQEEYPGNGMGLAICQKIVERHGGTIWVDSQLNCGATFYFTLPTCSS